MSARKTIDHDALRLAAADPSNRLRDLCAMFDISIGCLKDRLKELGIKRNRTSLPPRGHTPQHYAGLKPDDPGISGHAAREAELKELQPWPEGIWFG
jgi:hypothetical protein